MGKKRRNKHGQSGDGKATPYWSPVPRPAFTKAQKASIFARHLVPLALLIILGIWIIIFGLTRYVSLASICAAASLPLAAWLTGQSSTMIVIMGAMGVLAIYKHKANIHRLLKGTESRIGAKKTATPEPPKDRA